MSFRRNRLGWLRCRSSIARYSTEKEVIRTRAYSSRRAVGHPTHLGAGRAAIGPARLDYRACDGRAPVQTSTTRYARSSQTGR